MGHVFRLIGARLPDGVWRVDGDEAHHAVKVLRLGVGDDVEVTDGRGRWVRGAVTTARANEVVVAPREGGDEPAPAVPFVFVIGALKPGGVDEILAPLVELGVDEVWVFHQEESAKSRMSDKVVERWRRIVVQAVKQCKRAWVPTVVTFASLGEMLQAVAARQAGVRVMLAEGAAESLLERLDHVGNGQGRELFVVCGGEKGLAPGEERALREAGFDPCRLGPHVLRAVTAAVAAAAVVAEYRGRTP